MNPKSWTINWRGFSILKLNRDLRQTNEWDTGNSLSRTYKIYF